MPTAPLFDISAINRDGVAISPERIGEMNPQSGPMRQLDKVLWVRDDLVEALGTKQVRDDEFWVPHHIPGRPLMPGVLMLEAGAQLASVMFRLRGSDKFFGFTRCDDVVFRSQVVPGDELLLLGQQVKYNPRRMICNVQGWVGREIAFEAQITGMVV